MREKRLVLNGEMLRIPNLASLCAKPPPEESSPASQGQIYCIINSANGMRYIGQTTCYKLVAGKLVARGYEARFEKHLSNAFSENRETRNGCGKLYDAIRKYGRAVFSVSLLETCPCSELNAREKHWIKALKTRGKLGYNLTSGGQRPKKGRRR